jgi:hypothetical protein
MGRPRRGRGGRFDRRPVVAQIARQDREAVGTVGGGLLGLAVATIAAFVLTDDPGLSRTYTAGAGMAPALLYFTL